jgi:hypothetical protein
MIHTSNRDARALVYCREEFKGSNLFSHWNDERTIYAVYSYGFHWPLVAWVSGRGWFVNVEKYSVTTSIHLTHARPRVDAVEVGTDELKQIIRERKDQSEADPVRLGAMVASLGDVLGKDKKEANAWKKRMLSASVPKDPTGAPLLSFPDDWERLPEDEKERRLNKVIEVAQDKE